MTETLSVLLDPELVADELTEQAIAIEYMRDTIRRQATELAGLRGRK